MYHESEYEALQNLFWHYVFAHISMTPTATRRADHQGSQVTVAPRLGLVLYNAKKMATGYMQWDQMHPVLTHNASDLSDLIYEDFAQPPGRRGCAPTLPTTFVASHDVKKYVATLTPEQVEAGRDGGKVTKTGKRLVARRDAALDEAATCIGKLGINFLMKAHECSSKVARELVVHAAELGADLLCDGRSYAAIKSQMWAAIDDVAEQAIEARKAEEAQERKVGGGQGGARAREREARAKQALQEMTVAINEVRDEQQRVRLASSRSCRRWRRASARSAARRSRRSSSGAAPTARRSRRRRRATPSRSAARRTRPTPARS